MRRVCSLIAITFVALALAKPTPAYAITLKLSDLFKPFGKEARLEREINKLSLPNPVANGDLGERTFLQKITKIFDQTATIDKPKGWDIYKEDRLLTNPTLFISNDQNFTYGKASSLKINSIDQGVGIKQDIGKEVTIPFFFQANLLITEGQVHCSILDQDSVVVFEQTLNQNSEWQTVSNYLESPSSQPAMIIFASAVPNSEWYLTNISLTEKSKYDPFVKNLSDKSQELEDMVKEDNRKDIDECQGKEGDEWTQCVSEAIGLPPERWGEYGNPKLFYKGQEIKDGNQVLGMTLGESAKSVQRVYITLDITQQEARSLMSQVQHSWDNAGVNKSINFSQATIIPFDPNKQTECKQVGYWTKKTYYFPDSWCNDRAYRYAFLKNSANEGSSTIGETAVIGLGSSNAYSIKHETGHFLGTIDSDTIDINGNSLFPSGNKKKGTQYDDIMYDIKLNVGDYTRTFINNELKDIYLSYLPSRIILKKSTGEIVNDGTYLLYYGIPGPMHVPGTISSNSITGQISAGVLNISPSNILGVGNVAGFLLVNDGQDIYSGKYDLIDLNMARAGGTDLTITLQPANAGGLVGIFNKTGETISDLSAIRFAVSPKPNSGYSIKQWRLLSRVSGSRTEYNQVVSGNELVSQDDIKLAQKDSLFPTYYKGKFDLKLEGVFVKSGQPEFAIYTYVNELNLDPPYINEGYEYPFSNSINIQGSNLGDANDTSRKGLYITETNRYVDFPNPIYSSWEDNEINILRDRFLQEFSSAGQTLRIKAYHNSLSSNEIVLSYTLPSVTPTLAPMSTLIPTSTLAPTAQQCAQTNCKSACGTDEYWETRNSCQNSLKCCLLQPICRTPNLCTSSDYCTNQLRGYPISQLDCEEGTICCRLPTTTPVLSSTPTPRPTTPACYRCQFRFQSCNNPTSCYPECGLFQECCNTCTTPTPTIRPITPSPTPMPTNTPTPIPQFSACGSCSGDTEGGCSPSEDCRLINDQALCNSNGKKITPCCLNDVSCSPTYTTDCGAWQCSQNPWENKCLRYPACTWDLGCGSGHPAIPAVKIADNANLSFSSPMELKWYAFGENGQQDKGGCMGAETTEGAAMATGCWGYTCAKGSWGIPTDWRFYSVFVKAPNDADFRQVCHISDIPNPTTNDGQGTDKTSCSFSPTVTGNYQWYVIAGYKVVTSGGVDIQQSDVIIHNFNLINMGACDESCGYCGWKDPAGSCHQSAMPDNSWCCHFGCVDGKCIEVFGKGPDETVCKNTDGSRKAWGESCGTLPTNTPTPAPQGQCEYCRVYDANWAAASLPLKKGVLIYFSTKGNVTNGVNIGPNTKARFRINYQADVSWCNTNGLSLVDGWCETTNQRNGEFYIPYAPTIPGRLNIKSMLYNQTIGWY